MRVRHIGFNRPLSHIPVGNLGVMHRRVVLGEVGEGGHVGDRFELGRVVRLARDIFLRLMMEVVLLLLVGFQRLRHGGRRRVVVRVGFVVTLGFVPFRGSCSRVVR